MLLACLIVVAYLVGAVPFGVLITRARGVDVTKVGSGNIGATNVARAIGKEWAILVFLLDVMKGCGPVLVARTLIGNEWLWYVVGLASIAGHCASPFLRFKGGKGVATSLGMVFGASPIVAAGGFTMFIVLFAICRWVSLSSIVAVGGSVVIAALLRDWPYTAIGSLLFLFVLYTHRENIKRLRNGTEPKFTFKKGKPKDDDDGGAASLVAASPHGPAPRSGTALQEPPAATEGGK
ncbi:MAG TPA: glycerol-3-phosphate 1-O-acyltransferase PlsY [Fimbriimonadaceae bacterium]|nr:glycerol-3-phosphate 1-O-acyltransferase PlsY [Fimbriimonadaceae bacterium]